PERGDRAEIIGATNLARGVPLDRKPHIFRPHPLAVVFDPNRLLAAELDRDADAPGPGVDRVLDQFLDDRCRPLDDFAGRDLVRKVAGQNVDAAHGYSQPRNVNTTSIVVVTAPIHPTTHQNCAASPPGNIGSGTFIPHIPVSTVSGRKIVDMTVRTFTTTLSRLE